jgi:hypothetical protein
MECSIVAPAAPPHIVALHLMLDGGKWNILQPGVLDLDCHSPTLIVERTNPDAVPMLPISIALG